MNYSSLNFMVFVFITACVYFLFPAKKYQWTVLLAASIVFYLFAGYKYAAFIVLTGVSTYAAARFIDAIASKAREQLLEHKNDWDKAEKKAFKECVKKKKQRVLAVALVLNLGILAFLKYYGFLAGSLNSLLGTADISFSAPTLRLFLPLGISFYTFQSVGYVMDVYREKIPAERNIAKVFLFVSFFPQIIQGPISFYSQLAHQLYAQHTFSFTRAKHACELMLWGLFKKLVIADRAVSFISDAQNVYNDLNGIALAFTILLYALQLYADFSGGIDISRGVAQLFGIDLAQNFKRPYFATTINDYWRRWHISLGAWMREYVFYPLALCKPFTVMGKKIKASRFGATAAGAHVAKALPAALSSLVVFLLVGIWHGANWKYVGFGLWNGGVIMLSMLLEPAFKRLAQLLHVNTKALWFRVFQMLRTFVIVLIGYVFDVAPDFTSAIRSIGVMLTSHNLHQASLQIADLSLVEMDFGLLVVCTGVLFVVSLIQEKYSHTSIRVMLDQKPFILRYLMLLTGILVLLFFGIYGPGYDPAQFVYMQF